MAICNPGGGQISNQTGDEEEDTQEVTSLDEDDKDRNEIGCSCAVHTGIHTGVLAVECTHYRSYVEVEGENIALSKTDKKADKKADKKTDKKADGKTVGKIDEKTDEKTGAKTDGKTGTKAGAGVGCWCSENRSRGGVWPGLLQALPGYR